MIPMNNKPDWTSLERIEARLASEKARLDRLSAEVESDRVDLDRIARDLNRKSEPVWLEILGGIVVMASIAVIVIGIMLL